MATPKLWQSAEGEIHPLVEAYTIGEDYRLDQQLLPYDIMASKAHAGMLHQMEVLTLEEWKSVMKGLDDILEQWAKGNFQIALEQEDGHTAIEQYLSTHYGEIGKKIHTGRSRNDQSLVMLRLYAREQHQAVEAALEKVVGCFRETAHKHGQTPMPGYTHLQAAMPTTVGAWLGAYQDGFFDARSMLSCMDVILQQNPLGSASGFGIDSFPMDRNYTTEMLGFARTQENPLYCGLSRGWMEASFLNSLAPAMQMAGRFAQDMLLFTTREFGFFSLPEHFTTGSSIMPQKRNYDLFEVMRGQVRVFLGYQQQLSGIVAGLNSGYQRDLQLTKKPFLQGVELARHTFFLLAEVITALQVNTGRLDAAMDAELFVTDQVYRKVQEGVPFREAYQAVKHQWTNQART